MPQKFFMQIEKLQKVSRDKKKIQKSAKEIRGLGRGQTLNTSTWNFRRKEQGNGESLFIGKITDHSRTDEKMSNIWASQWSKVE